MTLVAKSVKDADVTTLMHFSRTVKGILVNCPTAASQEFTTIHQCAHLMLLV